MSNTSSYFPHAPLDREQDACGVGFIFRPQASFDVLRCSLTALARMEHRGACGADSESGDGAGIMTPIPWRIFQEEKLIGSSDNLAAGVVYIPGDHRNQCRQVAETFFTSEGFTVVAWRTVPVRPEVLGAMARTTCPTIEQVILSYSDIWTDAIAEQRLMSVRKRLINFIRYTLGLDDFYIASLSTKTMVYKGMVKAGVLPEFYPDLTNPLFSVNWAVFHRRFSTNTFPRWFLAQPFRMVSHNGEINTLLGNRHWMKAREPVLDHPVWTGREQEQQPVLYPKGSDSGNLDNVLEMIVRSGQTAEAALMQLIPEAYRQQPELEQYSEIGDFYDYYAALQEPWDGPALIVYSDGISLGALLDRNGLRPARFALLKDGSVILSSETGVVDVPEDQVLERGRLGPGQMISVDLQTGKVRRNTEIKRDVASSQRCKEWLEVRRYCLTRQAFTDSTFMPVADVLRLQTAFGFTKEDLDPLVETMAKTGAEHVFSMGDDAPPAVLSQHPRVLFDYFKQRFAQVTNPPIDHHREKLVMSLDVYLGRRSDLLHTSKEETRTVHLASPILNEDELRSLLSLDEEYFSYTTLSTLFKPEAHELSRALSTLCDQAADSVREGRRLLVLTDRGVDENNAPIPMLLAVGAVHHHLIKSGLRLDASLIVETGQAWTTHQFACLLGYGAQAICPYLSFETIRHWVNSESTQTHIAAAQSAAALAQSNVSENDAFGPYAGLTVDKAQANYRHAIEEGLLKVLSKMGISVLMSYIGAQIFECLGIGPKLIQRCFDGTTSKIGGLEVEDVAAEMLRFHGAAFPPPPAVSPSALVQRGFITNRKGGEYHGNNPQLVKALHETLKAHAENASNEERHEKFIAYSDLIRKRPPAAIRDLLRFNSDRFAISVDEVEPACEILKRFCTGGMSLGALSKEMHEVLAIAMNRIGGKSNSGEGGEDPARFYPIKNISADGTSPDFPGLRDLKTGDSAASAVRQVASARFGVTPEYLVTSQQLEIKIAQGAKPGEGGQLPGHKVSDYIARLRKAKPGMPLISPPPHHDIYSIEDLAQLIFDLRQVNPQAKISVKLVAGDGIGTIAAGVAKANADIVQISGHDGGTGASPLSSIKHCGLPWELGLSESHQVLLANKLRNRVALRVDGGLRSGWEVVIAAMLGADEFGFGSIALIAAGCIMARVCHTNNCPVGITSQKEELRKRFSGSPENIVKFFELIAEEVRQTLAQLGYRSLSEVIGRVDLLAQRDDVALVKTKSLNLNCLLTLQTPDPRDWLTPPLAPHENGAVLDDSILSDLDIANAIEHSTSVERFYLITNVDRAVGARISGRIAKRWGDHGFKGSIRLRFKGSAGQSFGAFNISNMRLELTGEANDYVGKGMSGGEIVIRPETHTEESTKDVIAGNTCLYGATGGAAFFAGRAGERFAVRNSGALAVVEGAGDHCCEYMTGGIAVILGPTGRNFGAGMTGGIAYVLDEDYSFEERFNPDGDKSRQRLSPQAAAALKAIIEEHVNLTGSEKGRQILADWAQYLMKFWQIVPPAEAERAQEAELTVQVLANVFEAAYRS